MGKSPHSDADVDETPSTRWHGSPLTVIACDIWVSDGSIMNGYIIETTRENKSRPGGQESVRWIGVMRSARQMISVLSGHSPSVVDRGPGVLARARMLGLKEGEFQEFDAY